jgi:HK97 family phage prohead protease
MAIKQNELEKRTALGNIELRSAGEGSKSPGTIVGYAAVFDSDSEDLGYFIERIAPGAFARTIQADDIRALRNHEPEALLGRVSSGTCRLKEDAKGLLMEIDLPDTSVGRDTAEMIRRGDMSGCSFSFGVNKEEWNYDATPPIRTLRDVDVADVGPVTFPAYRDTSVALRSLEANRPRPTIPLGLLRAKIRLAEAFEEKVP